MPPSRWISGRYPEPGASAIGDAIRQRRGDRGLTPLDGALLHVPPVAEGWNSLLGAIRTKGKLRGDMRELMILRVAACNRAAYEWIHHEHVARSEGLTIPQLRAIRDISTEPAAGVFSPLQAAALKFAHASTQDIVVPPEVASALKAALADEEEMSQDLFVESAAVVSTYNMVSRFLVSVDVSGASEDPVPWPYERREHRVPIAGLEERFIHAITLIVDPAAPWIAFANSLLTDLTMWDRVTPYLTAPVEGAPHGYNVLLHSARGHGQTAITPGRLTIPQLARDIDTILTYLNIPRVHSVIGVSQGGAAALSFGVQFPHRTGTVVACDTGPCTPKGNRTAWAERIAIAKKDGMSALADITLPRWFPPGSPCAPHTGTRKARAAWLSDMIRTTTIPGFVLGASALMDYDLFEASEENGGKGLLDISVPALLIAGSLDGGGKVAASMEALSEKLGSKARLATIPDAGHLPMVDQTERFWEALRPFLGS
ncbi:alpha/beta-hydrolase [Fistulina hepatica ATCC 64428]|uniref:Alpha/beta-hydrolase n=1 Tax=Fistulina hepatica ATCC 64428 TaxID=1128425 RepID=A0A0D7A774_9AGAR|nr:alpha/beta-hydrolase [Fistulina hepatica ATCC 64428]